MKLQKLFNGLGYVKYVYTEYYKEIYIIFLNVNTRVLPINISGFKKVFRFGAIAVYCLAFYFLNSGSKVEVKSSWPGCIGLHTCYKGENKELRKVNLE